MVWYQTSNDVLVNLDRVDFIEARITDSGVVKLLGIAGDRTHTLAQFESERAARHEIKYISHLLNRGRS